MGDPREPNGVALEDLQLPSQSTSQSSSSCSAPNPFGVGSEKWAQAERVTQEIIWRVQPTFVSEERRREVIDYVQRLLRNRLGYEVFPFGSVPLKTYLPDGDIDLTAFGDFNVEEVLAEKVYSELESEDCNPAAECMVKDVQYIGAEVKLVKCLVQNIVVDISFNQIGGLCALCFLEQVDRRIGKNHLFKRSIILIKAWCYYESRILGAHHGLISTYALETLVLYIFHLYHSSLNGPLAVLYKFLDFYSKFDWENFCVSLNGPVHVSSLPEILAEKPDNGGGDLLLSSDFLKECVEMFSVPSRGNEMSSRTFSPKHLNIVDPLKESNNLGRSVSKGNFFRIRSAFSFGARKLGQILLRPDESVAEEVRRFFSNTLVRHGRGQRPDVHDPPPMPFPVGFADDMGYEMSQDGAGHAPDHVNSSCMSDDYRVVYQEKQPDGADGVHDLEENLSRTNNKHQRGLKKQDPFTMLSEAGRAKDDEVFAPGGRFSGDAKDLAASAIQSFRITDDVNESSISSEKERKSRLGAAPHAPHLYFSHLSRNGKMANGHLIEKQLPNSGSGDGKASLSLPRPHDEDTGLITWRPVDENLVGYFDSNSGSSATTPDARHSEDAEFNCLECPSTRMTARNYETMSPLSDLTGDYDNDLKSLHHGRWWLSALPMHALQRKNPWDTLRHSVHFRQNMFANVNGNGVIPRPPFFHVNHLIVPGGAAFSVEELPKARGTGLYFPVTNHQSFRERSSAKALKSPRNNGRAVGSLDKSPFVRSSHEAAQTQSLVRQGSAKPRSLDLQDTVSPRGKVHKDVNGFTPPVESSVEFGTLRHLPSESPRLEGSQLLNSDSSPSRNSGMGPLASRRQTGEAQLFKNDDRLGSQPYRLKDEDFPPLSV
ncbi:hypothetical protein Ancab_031427 [Ancistrocladus abbreviatus]